mmetsp:Transcript_39732/g.55331  ORF Transcript_39732/g.55331 Transcript_39732/m.55331 type:complete len:346 (-) Transcript_39732:103-1140(-)
MAPVEGGSVNHHSPISRDFVSEKFRKGTHHITRVLSEMVAQTKIVEKLTSLNQLVHHLVSHHLNLQIFQFFYIGEVVDLEVFFNVEKLFAIRFYHFSNQIEMVMVLAFHNRSTNSATTLPRVNLAPLFKNKPESRENCLLLLQKCLDLLDHRFLKFGDFTQESSDNGAFFSGPISFQLGKKENELLTFDVTRLLLLLCEPPVDQLNPLSRQRVFETLLLDLKLSVRENRASLKIIFVDDVSQQQLEPRKSLDTQFVDNIILFDFQNLVGVAVVTSDRLNGNFLTTELAKFLPHRSLLLLMRFFLFAHLAILLIYLLLLFSLLFFLNLNLRRLCWPLHFVSKERFF